MHWVRATIESQPEMVQELVPAARERLGDAQAGLADAQAFLREAGWFGARAHELWR
jgi:hypothetical protein